jgi:hypothetical protein
MAVDTTLRDADSALVRGHGQRASLAASRLDSPLHHATLLQHRHHSVDEIDKGTGRNRVREIETITPASIHSWKESAICSGVPTSTGPAPPIPAYFAKSLVSIYGSGQPR